MYQENRKSFPAIFAALLGASIVAGTTLAPPTPVFADNCDCEEIDDIKLDIAVHAAQALNAPSAADITEWCAEGSIALQEDDGPKDNKDDNVACVDLSIESMMRHFTYTLPNGDAGSEDITTMTEFWAIVDAAAVVEKVYEIIIINDMDIASQGGSLLGQSPVGEKSVVLVERATTYILAHEVGHWAGLSGDHNGEDVNWLMTAEALTDDSVRLLADEAAAFETLASED